MTKGNLQGDFYVHFSGLCSFRWDSIACEERVTNIRPTPSSIKVLVNRWVHSCRIRRQPQLQIFVDVHEEQGTKMSFMMQDLEAKKGGRVFDESTNVSTR